MENKLLKIFFLITFFLWQFLFLFLPFLIIIFNGINYKNLYYDSIWIIRSGYISIIMRSIFYGFIASFFCLIIGYFISYAISKKNELTKNILTLLIAIPFSTNFIVHIITWASVLNSSGPILSFLSFLKLCKPNYSILYTNFAIIFGYIYCYLPFMFFPIYNSLTKFNMSLVEASYDLGGSWAKTFLKVIIPGTKHAINTGFFLVFIPSCSEFIIPEILGGDRYMFCGTALSNVLFNNALTQKGALMTLFFILFLCISSFFIYIIINKSIKYIEQW
jgi:spermidine/putrescine transport system permease protein